MQGIIRNPAETLREMAEPILMGMLRWDRSGQALLISDAPRRVGEAAALEAVRRLPARALIADGLLYLDLPPDDYWALLGIDCKARGTWRADWYEVQALLAGILNRPSIGPTVPDERLLRKALLACAQGAPHIRAFCTLLRTADATSLRDGHTASCRACAALVAQRLWAIHRIGLPEVKSIANVER